MMMAVILKPVAHLLFIFLLFANVIDAFQNATRMKVRFLLLLLYTNIEVKAAMSNR